MRLIALVLCSFPVLADPPFLPVASCDKGLCTIKEADYATLQRFHAQAVQAMIQTQRENADLENALAEARQKIVRQAYCNQWRS